MWYNYSMNKDVIYIESEDDITDIIGKIENSKEKIVALVPPKKAGVFRSVVNIKLIAKAGNNSEKTIVLVTTDPSIIRLAATTRLPVTKDLQSAPAVPSSEDGTVGTSSTETIGESKEALEESSEEALEESSASAKGNAEEEPEVIKEDRREKEGEEDNDEDEEEDKAEKVDKKKHRKKEKEKQNKTGGSWLKRRKRRLIVGGVGVVLLVILLVWALVIAPAVTITVDINTAANNFSENVTFTANMSEEDALEGKFYIEEKKFEASSEVEFDATGKKNVGEKATGILTVYTTISYRGGTKIISAGDTFTNNGLVYVADNSLTMSFDGEDTSVCANDKVTYAEFIQQGGCRIYAKVKVTAAQPGSVYNIAATDNGWKPTPDVGVYLESAMTGGTDEEITVVTQADVDKAKAQLAETNEAESKDKLLEGLDERLLVISSSFSQTASEATSTPAVGEEVKEGAKAVLKATKTASIYAVDKTKVEQFITAKANLPEGQVIYELKDPFVESFTKVNGGFAGKLKAVYTTGPEMTENSIIEIVKGKGLGEAQHTLRDIKGIASVTIDTSFPWVFSVPNDANKITVILKVKDQDSDKTDKKTEDDVGKKAEESEE